MKLSAVVALISLDVVTELVKAGYVVSSVDVISATNTSPIVVETDAGHGFVIDAHVVVADVAGNTAANRLDSDGVTNDAWVAVVVDDTHLALYTVDPATGLLVASQGNGAYSGGGTVKAALTHGKILLGRQHIFEESSPPRIIFVPTAVPFGPRDPANPSRQAGYPSAEVKLQNQLRTIRTGKLAFEVHCWGVAQHADPDLDFDATQVLYEQVIRSGHAVATGLMELTDGTWADQAADVAQLLKLGHEFVFGLVIAAPIVDRLLPYAPQNVAPGLKVYLDPGDGSPPELAFQQ